jgi:hypothetical protein
MGTKLIMVKVVFTYFVQYFKKGNDTPYNSYAEDYVKTKAFSENIPYNQILEDCRKEIQSEFELTSKDTDEETNEEFECDITYDISRLVSYGIVAEED